ncbi:LysR substrate-binding domain-containing protein [Salinicola peritrichatus]|uniref:LysR substrate-binding domain-containing protein n=1 Tax=Salinicola peritrichatus TaxID=1267424 RepID=UPI000DA140E5|nr:LysR substrate-binding domain-containing protein [Salinicola peritrichatus]
MSSRLPSLLSLRAFEAAARHLSFTYAADELFLTQSAISRHVRGLEELLGQRLFDRFTRRVELTPTGLEYYRAIQIALGDIEKATQRAKETDQRTSITINVMQTLGATWLMPKLASFSETYPHIDIRMISSIAPVNFQTNEIDVAIRCGRLPGSPRQPGRPRIESEMVTSWKGINAEFLLPDVLVPVVSSKLLSQGAEINSPKDLLKYRLIHNTSRPHAWPDWLAAHGVRLTSRTESIHYGHFFMALRAALNCKGVAILPAILVDHSLESMDLVRPLPGTIESDGAYYLLTREDANTNRSVHTFCNWLLTEAHNEGKPAIDTQP